jgi:hypothetical protein
MNAVPVQGKYDPLACYNSGKSLRAIGQEGNLSTSNVYATLIAAQLAGQQVSWHKRAKLGQLTTDQFETIYNKYNSGNNVEAILRDINQTIGRNVTVTRGMMYNVLHGYEAAGKEVKWLSKKNSIDTRVGQTVAQQTFTEVAQGVYFLDNSSQTTSTVAPTSLEITVGSNGVLPSDRSPDPATYTNRLTQPRTWFRGAYRACLATVASLAILAAGALALLPTACGPSAPKNDNYKNPPKAATSQKLDAASSPKPQVYSPTTTPWQTASPNVLNNTGSIDNVAANAGNPAIKPENPKRPSQDIKPAYTGPNPPEKKAKPKTDSPKPAVSTATDPDAPVAYKFTLVGSDKKGETGYLAQNGLVFPHWWNARDNKWETNPFNNGSGVPSNGEFTAIDKHGKEVGTFNTTTYNINIPNGTPASGVFKILSDYYKIWQSKIAALNQFSVPTTAANQAPSPTTSTSANPAAVAQIVSSSQPSSVLSPLAASYRQMVGNSSAYSIDDVASLLNQTHKLKTREGHAMSYGLGRVISQKLYLESQDTNLDLVQRYVSLKIARRIGIDDPFLKIEYDKQAPKMLREISKMKNGKSKVASLFKEFVRRYHLGPENTTFNWKFLKTVGEYPFPVYLPVHVGRTVEHSAINGVPGSSDKVTEQIKKYNTEMQQRINQAGYTSSDNIEHAFWTQVQHPGLMPLQEMQTLNAAIKMNPKTRARLAHGHDSALAFRHHLEAEQALKDGRLAIANAHFLAAMALLAEESHTRAMAGYQWHGDARRLNPNVVNAGETIEGIEAILKIVTIPYAPDLQRGKNHLFGHDVFLVVKDAALYWLIYSGVSCGGGGGHLKVFPLDTSSGGGGTGGTGAGFGSGSGGAGGSGAGLP